MEAQFAPKLLDRFRYDAWEGSGALDMYRRCNVEAKRILAEHEMKPKSKEVLKQIDTIVNQ
jgi:trimethylamine:corrinoid methyltransferase-like protein